MTVTHSKIQTPKYSVVAERYSIVKRVKAALRIFVFSFILLTILSFASSFFAFALSEEELFSEPLRQLSYRLFLFFRFPAHYVSLSAYLPIQLIAGSAIYSLFVAFTLFGLRWPSQLFKY